MMLNSGIRLGLLLALSALLVPATATAQSRASNASVHASTQVPASVYEALKSSGEFVVEGISASAQMTVLTITAAGIMTSFSLVLAVEPAMSERSGPETSLGKVIETSGGLFLKVGWTILAFIPDPSAQSHIHSRKVA